MKKKFILLLTVFMLIPFSVNAQTLADYVTGLVDTDDSVVADDPDHNPRYIGANPNNYVLFNNELWRIVGVFDGKVKLVRKESLLDLALFDRTSNYRINNGWGTNYWPESALKKQLNGDYLNADLAADTNWSGHTFDHTRVLTTEAQSMIADSVWHLGAANYDGTTRYDNLSANLAYTNERGNYRAVYDTTSSMANDGFVREPTWTGKVGLLYASDYTYSTAGYDNGTREECLATSSWGASPVNTCYKHSWLSSRNSIAITPYYQANRAIYVYITTIHGSSSCLVNSIADSHLFPVVYLKKSVSFNDGTGTADDPFRMTNPRQVTFNTNGGETINDQYIEPNQKATKPTNPTKEDNNFLGWYTDPELTNEFNFDTTITADLTLYAKWRFEYKIIEGKDQTFEDKDIVIKCNGNINDLQSIKIGENEVDPSNYTLVEGSTILTLKKEYLSTLSAGVHNITFVYPDGSATTTLTIKEKASNTEKLVNPKTGDNITLYIVLLGISIIGLSKTLMYTKKLDI